MSDPMRLQKWLAGAGLCSRREGDKWIAAGRVSVNGQVVTQLGSKVDAKDKVVVDGRIIPYNHDALVILAMNKPPGVLCTRKDPENRSNVFDLLGDLSASIDTPTRSAPTRSAMRSSGAPRQSSQEGSPHTRLISVGRLDYNSEGLILFTNNGNVAHGLMHPSSQVPRTYRVRVHGRVDIPMLEKMRAGVLLDDGHTGPLDMDLDYVLGANSWLKLTLTEGRNRMVRRIFEAVDMNVSRLIRISYGHAVLGDLPRGKWRTLQPFEIARLLTHIKNIKIPPVSKPENERQGVNV